MVAFLQISIPSGSWGRVRSLPGNSQLSSFSEGEGGSRRRGWAIAVPQERGLPEFLTLRKGHQAERKREAPSPIFYVLCSLSGPWRG